MRYADPCLYVIGDIDDFEPLMVLDRAISPAEMKLHLESFVEHEREARLRFDRCIASGSRQQFSTAVVPGISIVHGCPFKGTGILIYRSELAGELDGVAEFVSALITESLARHEPSPP